MFKTSRLGRIFNQNIVNIVVATLAIAFVIIVVQALNYITKMQNQGNTSQRNNQVTSSLDTSSETVIYGSHVETQTNDKNKEVIEQFIKSCNQGEIETAYNMLTDSCKETYYQDLETFYRTYYQVVFNNAKSYDLQSWINTNQSYTYKIKLMDDILAYGGYHADNTFEDYYTIDRNENGKLNINSYIGEQEINREIEEDGIKVKIESKKVYINHETYIVTVENNSENSMMLDSKETLQSMYLLGDNELKYSSYIDEVPTEDLIVRASEKKQIRIKFNKIYNPEKKVKFIVFNDMIKNYEGYSVLNNKQQYQARAKIQIPI